MLLQKVSLLVMLCPAIFAVCCYKKQVNFKLKTTGDDCYYYENAKNNIRRGNVGVADAITGRCRVSVCGNGRRPSGTYCGIGGCNIVGCDCTGGCIPGDAVQEFRNRHGHAVVGIHQDKIDALQDSVYYG